MAALAWSEGGVLDPLTVGGLVSIPTSLNQQGPEPNKSWLQLPKNLFEPLLL